MGPKRFLNLGCNKERNPLEYNLDPNSEVGLKTSLPVFPIRRCWVCGSRLDWGGPCQNVGCPAPTFVCPKWAINWILPWPGGQNIGSSWPGPSNWALTSWWGPLSPFHWELGPTVPMGAPKVLVGTSRGPDGTTPSGRGFLRSGVFGAGGV